MLTSLACMPCDSEFLIFIISNYCPQVLISNFRALHYVRMIYVVMCECEVV